MLSSALQNVPALTQKFAGLRVYFLYFYDFTFMAFDLILAHSSFLLWELQQQFIIQPTVICKHSAQHPACCNADSEQHTFI